MPAAVSNPVEDCFLNKIYNESLCELVLTDSLSLKSQKIFFLVTICNK